LFRALPPPAHCLLTLRLYDTICGKPGSHSIPGRFRTERERNHVADTKKIEDKLERKKVKRTARKKAAPKAKRTTARGEKKRKVKKMIRGQSKR